MRPDQKDLLEGLDATFTIDLGAVTRRLQEPPVSGVRRLLDRGFVELLGRWTARGVERAQEKRAAVGAPWHLSDPEYRAGLASRLAGRLTATRLYYGRRVPAWQQEYLQVAGDAAKQLATALRSGADLRQAPPEVQIVQDTVVASYHGAVSVALGDVAAGAKPGPALGPRYVFPLANAGEAQRRLAHLLDPQSSAPVAPLRPAWTPPYGPVGEVSGESAEGKPENHVFVPEGVLSQDPVSGRAEATPAGGRWVPLEVPLPRHSQGVHASLAGMGVPPGVVQPAPPVLPTERASRSGPGRNGQEQGPKARDQTRGDEGPEQRLGPRPGPH